MTYTENIENKLEIKYGRTSYTKNIRFNFWDLRTLVKEGKILSLFGFFPLPFIQEPKIIRYNNLFMNYFNTSTGKADYFNLIMYFSFGDTDGETIFNDLFKIYQEEFPKKMIREDIEKIRLINNKLFNKQLKKSLFNTDISKFKNIIRKYFYIGDIQSVFFSSRITDIYALLRMFKTFDKQKKSRDKCDDNDYFKNILYFAGNSHTDFIKNVITHYFEYNIKQFISKKANPEKDYRCIYFDKPYRFFADNIEV
jgi:hypothetical protein